MNPSVQLVTKVEYYHNFYNTSPRRLFGAINMEGSKGYVESMLCTALINVSIREEKLGRGRHRNSIRQKLFEIPTAGLDLLA